MTIRVQNLVKNYRVTEKQPLLRSMFLPKYREIVAVRDITFEIKPGETVGFLGPNGAGKTTTIKMLAGLLYPTSGNVEVLGYTPTDRDPQFLTQIGLVMGNKSGLSWDLSPDQSYELIRVIYSIEKSAFNKALENLSTMLDIKDILDTPVRKLSLGQRMKAELVGAILHEPRILFLDEPTLGLDVVAKKRLREFIRHINAENKTTILLTSHDMDDIEDVCDRVIIINFGKLLFDGTLESLKARYRDHKYITFIFKSKVHPENLDQFGRIVRQKDLSITLEIDSQRQSEVVGEVMKKFPVDDIDVMSPPLDEIIRNIFEVSSAKQRVGRIYT